MVSISELRQIMFVQYLAHSKLSINISYYLQQQKHLKFIFTIAIGLSFNCKQFFFLKAMLILGQGYTVFGTQLQSPPRTNHTLFPVACKYGSLKGTVKTRHPCRMLRLQQSALWCTQLEARMGGDYEKQCFAQESEVDLCEYKELL